MRVVSMALWGLDPKYLCGAVVNVRLGERFYPGWVYRIFHAADTPEDTRAKLRDAGAVLLECPGDSRRLGLYWRMAPVFEPSMGAVIIRDADSRPSVREADAVEQWLESGRAIHTIRDHRCHTTPIMGGLWGARPAKLAGLLPGLRKAWENRCEFVARAPESAGRPKHGYLPFSDQDWLATDVWAELSRAEIMVHDDRKFTGKEDLPLRVRLSSPIEFCGQVYDGSGRPKFKP